MKPLPLLLIGVLLALATGVVWTARSANGAARAGSSSEQLAPLLERIDALAERTAALEQRLERTAARLDESEVVAPGAAQRIPAGAIDDAVARWMAASAKGEARALDPDEGGASADPKLEQRRRELLARLESGTLSGAEFDALWYELRDAGLEGAALAALQARAKAYPGDVEAQFELGRGYVYELGGVGDGPEKGKLAMLADQAFDRALELDDQHWESRFMKAVSLSHWPPFLGKQAEAIKQFELLRTQQESGPPQGSHAQTYVYLGNLYREAGQFDKAQSTWQAGLALFPHDAALAEQLAAFD